MKYLLLTAAAALYVEACDRNWSRFADQVRAQANKRLGFSPMDFMRAAVNYNQSR